MDVVAVWFRNDLRIHDNDSLNEAVRIIKSKIASHVLPVFCYDPRYFGKHAHSREAGLERTGIHRQRFVAESLRDLRKSLRAIGSDLLILEGRPEDMFPKLLPRGSIIVTQKQVTQEEIDIDLLVKNAGFNLQTVWGLTMYDLRDIVGASGWGEGAKFPSKSKIDSDVEKSGITPRPCLPTPHHGDLPFPATGGNDGDGNSDTADHLKLYDIARVQEPFLYADGTGERSVYDDKYTYQVDPRGVMGGSGSAALEFTKRPLGFRGGESAGLERVAYYFVKTRMSNFRTKRMYQMLGADYSTKFSPWLAQGCLSPRLIYHRLKENASITKDAKKILITMLSWRDYFIFYVRSHNPKIFRLNWLQTWKDAKWISPDRAQPLFQKWIKGETGNPMVDANMRELASTGYMSNRGRLVVSLFLVYDLQVDWRWGAEHFEKVLVDHDVCLNWGNWHARAGLKRQIFSRTKGTLKIANIDWQFKKHDPKGLYVRHWIPGLRCVPDEFVFEPWNWPGRDKIRASPGGYFVCGDHTSPATAKPAFSPKSGKQLKRAIDLCLSQSPEDDCFKVCKTRARSPEGDCFKACKTRAQYKAAMDKHSNAARLLNVAKKVGTVHLKGFITVKTSEAMSPAMPISINSPTATFGSISTPRYTDTTSSKTTTMTVTTAVTTMSSTPASMSTITAPIGSTNTSIATSVNALIAASIDKLVSTPTLKSSTTNTSIDMSMVTLVHSDVLPAGTTATAATTAPSIATLTAPEATSITDWLSQDFVVVGIFLICAVLLMAIALATRRCFVFIRKTTLLPKTNFSGRKKTLYRIYSRY